MKLVESFIARVVAQFGGPRGSGADGWLHRGRHEANAPHASEPDRRPVQSTTGIVGSLVGLVLATRPSNRERNRWRIGLLQSRDGDRVLEIGFGPGLSIEMAARLVGRGKVRTVANMGFSVTARCNARP